MARAPAAQSGCYVAVQHDGHCREIPQERGIYIAVQQSLEVLNYFDSSPPNSMGF
ncbi:MAG TPA: hypothetical protein VIM63_00865 [Rhodoferax sp.]